ncbi:MAG: glycosyltransferase [Bacteroidales bacterium]|jgi:glycosyltransferase involved in cell wall biosynthesis|nr:glycosyltransferase [Bacteroidales bacterium]
MKNTKKLLVVSGGKSIHTYNLISLIRDYFSKTLLITDYDNKEEKDVEKKIISFSFKNPIKIIASLLSIRKTIKEFKPNFIVMYQVDTSAMMTLIINRGRIPTLIMAMGSDILINKDKGFFHRMLIKYVLNKAKYHSTGSMWVADNMKKLASKNIDPLIANTGFETNIKPKEKQNIIFSNRLHRPLYQIPKIIKAFSLFHKENPLWQLVIAGGEDKENLHSLVKELNIESAVKFVGWLNKEENNYYYEISRIWVSIPQSDSIAISLMEAMIGGCIPVVSSLPSMKESIEDGKTGIIVTNYDTNFFERALSLDYPYLLETNLQKARLFGSKEINRNKFFEIFDKEFKEYE